MPKFNGEIIYFKKHQAYVSSVPTVLYQVCNYLAECPKRKSSEPQDAGVTHTVDYASPTRNMQQCNFECCIKVWACKTTAFLREVSTVPDYSPRKIGFTTSMGTKKRHGKAEDNPDKAISDYRGSQSKKPAVCIIADFLYLGPVSAASNVGFLRTHEITTIVSIGRTPQRIKDIILTAKGPTPITYHRLHLTDTANSDLIPCADIFCAILDEAFASEAKVLVHCFSAISRSPAMIAAYLIKRRRYTLQESLEILQAARPAISPNPGFLNQLQVRARTSSEACCTSAS